MYERASVVVSLRLFYLTATTWNQFLHGQKKRLTLSVQSCQTAQSDDKKSRASTRDFYRALFAWYAD